VRSIAAIVFSNVGPAGSLALALWSAPLAVGVVTKIASRDRLKAAVVDAAFSGRRAADVEQAGRNHAERIRERWLRDDTVARLRWHQQAGHRTVLVSASLRPYLDPFGAWLGVDGVVCTDLGVDAEGRLDGTLLDGNCRAAAKVARLYEHLGGRPATLWAYGDSAGDRELLAEADHAHLVGKRSALAADPGTAG
jgi:phosphatidylglycerophosphatase C